MQRRNMAFDGGNSVESKSSVDPSPEYSSFIVTFTQAFHNYIICRIHV